MGGDNFFDLFLDAHGLFPQKIGGCCNPALIIAELLSGFALYGGGKKAIGTVEAGIQAQIAAGIQIDFGRL